MLRCSECGEILKMSNAEAEIIAEYGEKAAEQYGLIRCDYTECDDCEEEREREEREKEHWEWE